MKTLSASVNQHPPVQQSAVLFTGEGEGGISHPVVECALTTVNLFGADPFLGSIFSYGSLDSDLTYIALYYLLIGYWFYINCSTSGGACCS
jgi:hypothetical protein